MGFLIEVNFSGGIEPRGNWGFYRERERGKMKGRKAMGWDVGG